MIADAGMCKNTSQPARERARRSAIAASYEDRRAERELLAELRIGDARAWDTLVRRYNGRMVSAARRLLRCEAESLDAVQDAWLAAYKAIHSFRHQSQISTWLHRIVQNECLMRLRGRRDRKLLALDRKAAEDIVDHRETRRPLVNAVEYPMELRELRRSIECAIARLPADQQLILQLRDLEEHDTSATADVLHISCGAVKTRLHRARRSLRALLESMD